jgi:hypothetical protein
MGEWSAKGRHPKGKANSLAKAAIIMYAFPTKIEYPYCFQVEANVGGLWNFLN